MSLKEILKEKFQAEKLTPVGLHCFIGLSKGATFDEEGGSVFIKTNTKQEADVMLNGEAAALRAINECHCILAPTPLEVRDLKPRGWALVMNYISMTESDRDVDLKLASDLAKLHLSNKELLEQKEHDEGFMSDEKERVPVTQFGFDVPTSCDAIVQNNEWTDDWATFFIRNRLKPTVDKLIEKGDRDLLQKWPKLERAATSLLEHTEKVAPALVHGQLWSGNWGCTDEWEPVVYDPASFYADPEFEEGMMKMFGGFGASFWKQYHVLVPKREGREQRVQLYELFHHLNHWNYFGSGYKESSMDLINRIIGL